MALWYVVSTATGAGDGTSEADAFTTLDAALSEPTLAGGDTIYIKDTATYTETANVDTAGAVNNYITVEGYTSSTGDGGKVTIDGTGNQNTLTDTPATNYYVWKNLIFQNATFAGVNFGNSHTFVNCDFKNNGGGGLQAIASITCINCTFTGNSQLGATVNQGAKFMGCIFSGNGNEAIDFNGSGDCSIYKCVFFNNSTTLDMVNECGNNLCVIGSTFDAEGSTTIDCISWNSGAYPELIVDNIFYDANYALNFTNIGVEEARAFIGYNLVNSMNTGSYNTAAGANPIIGFGDVASAPAFTDEANDDYTLGTFSPAKDTGLYPGGTT